VTQRRCCCYCCCVSEAPSALTTPQKEVQTLEDNRHEEKTRHPFPSCKIPKNSLSVSLSKSVFSAVYLLKYPRLLPDAQSNKQVQTESYSHFFPLFFYWLFSYTLFKLEQQKKPTTDYSLLIHFFFEGGKGALFFLLDLLCGLQS